VGPNIVDAKEQLSGEAAMQKIRALLPQFRSAMLVTHGTAGDVHARPLALQGDLTRFGGVLWFFADQRSRKVQELTGSVPVSVICQSDEHSAYLHLTGTSTTVRDLPKMRELYSETLKTWFPEGLDDPNLTLIRFEAEKGAYWETPGGLLQVALSFAKSMAMGGPGKTSNAGELRI
jgi:general stress protein 26